MKQILFKGSVRFLALGLVIFSFPVISRADDTNVDLIVEGCNNNTICESIIGEDLASCPNDCTPPPPTPTPPPSSTSGQSTGGSTLPNGQGITLDYLTVTAFADYVSIRWGTNVPAQTVISWGKTDDYEFGTLAETVYTKEHDAKLTDLVPSTRYRLKMSLRAADGSTITNIFSFETEPASGKAPLYEVGELKAVNRLQGIELSWVNPTRSDFSSIRIMRDEKTFPKNYYSGKLVYEGSGNMFLDKDVVSGKTYFYSVFVKYSSEDTSGGAVATSHYTKTKTYPLESDTGSSVGAGQSIYEYPDSDFWPEGIRYVNFAQHGKNISFVQSRIIIDGESETGVSLSGDAVFNPKSTVLIYVYKKDSLIPSDVFTLSRDEKTGNFNVNLAPFLDQKEIPFRIFISNSDGSRKRIEGMFDVRLSGGGAGDSGTSSPSGDGGTFFQDYVIRHAMFIFWIFVFLVLWIVFYCLKHLQKIKK